MKRVSSPMTSAVGPELVAALRAVQAKLVCVILFRMLACVSARSWEVSLRGVYVWALLGLSLPRGVGCGCSLGAQLARQWRRKPSLCRGLSGGLLYRTREACTCTCVFAGGGGVCHSQCVPAG
jgi:hypothetical protein